MGMVMIRCPVTRRAIPTGIQTDRATFRSTPVFYSQVACPLCLAVHDWFAKDAWVCDCGLGECNPNCEQLVA